MPGVYHGDDYDLAGFAVGAAERGAILPRDDIARGRRRARPRLVRRAFQRLFAGAQGRRASPSCNWNAPAPFDNDAQARRRPCSTPTRIYVKSCLAAIRETKAVKALAHITGGGFPDNIPRVLPKGFGARIDLARVPVLPVFQWLAAGRRHRRDGNAAHLQLRHRHDRRGRAAQGRRGRRGARARGRDASCGSARSSPRRRASRA